MQSLYGNIARVQFPALSPALPDPTARASLWDLAVRHRPRSVAEPSPERLSRDVLSRAAHENAVQRSGEDAQRRGGGPGGRPRAEAQDRQQAASTPWFTGSGGHYTSGSDDDDAFLGDPLVTGLPRMSAADEHLADTPGHFTLRLQDCGLLDSAGRITARGMRRLEPSQAQSIHLVINKMLSMNRRHQTVLAVVRDVGEHMSPVNVATAMHRLGKLVRGAKAWDPGAAERTLAQPQYRFLLRRAEELAQDIAPRALANFLWGMAALGDSGSAAVVRALGQRLMSVDCGKLKTQEVSNVVWSLAKLEVAMPQLVDRMLDWATEHVDDCIPQALSNMVWACAVLRHHHPAFLDAVAANAASRLGDFESQALANTLWGYSVLGVYPQPLFTAAADEIVARIRRGGTRGGRQGGPGHIGFQRDVSVSEPAAAAQDAPFHSGGRGQGGWPTVDAAAPAPSDGGRRPGPRGGAWYGATPRPTSWGDSPPRFLGQEVSNILIAYARGCIIHQGLLQALESELCQPSWVLRGGRRTQIVRAQEFTSQALANTLWAFASLRWYPARLLPVITEALAVYVPAMSAQELANSLWSYARFAYHPGRVMAAYLAAIERRIEDFEPQGCTNCLWSLAVLKATHSSAFVGLLRQCVKLERSGAIHGDLWYNQVLQAVLLAQFEARGGRVAWRPEVDLPEELVDKALSAWACQQAVAQLSGFHLDVSEGLKRLGVEHEIEFLVANELLSIDIAVIKDGRRIAIEVDGPFHFPVNARTPLGHTMIRRRLLRAAGWTAVSVPWYDWFVMPTWVQRCEYLATCLNKADASFAEELRPATRELLSAEFTPGPGELSPEGGLSGPGGLICDGRGGSLDGGEEEDGPSLSYDDDAGAGGGPAGAGAGARVLGSADSGLLSVLSSRNVSLTDGAMRRLQSMGLGSVAQAVLERRDAQRGGSFASSYVPPPSSTPPPSTDSGGGGADLMPKPVLPRIARSSLQGGGPAPQASHRFTPRFADHPPSVERPRARERPMSPSFPPVRPERAARQAALPAPGPSKGGNTPGEGAGAINGDSVAAQRATPQQKAFGQGPPQQAEAGTKPQRGAGAPRRVALRQATGTRGPAAQSATRARGMSNNAAAADAVISRVLRGTAASPLPPPTEAGR